MRRSTPTTLTTWQRLVILTCTATAAFVCLHGMSSRDSESSTPPKSEGVGESGESDFVTIPIDQIMGGDPVQLPQDDPRILKYIWDRGYLKGPSNLDYNLTKPNTDPSMGQGQLIQKLFKGVNHGFFIETGALDGETRSNTLFLEKLGWTGLLIEADPKNYAILLSKNRKAWTSNSCVATKAYPHKVTFQQHFNLGKISDTNKSNKNTAVVQCFPLYSLLSALKITTIDYFSLDVEGVEMGVLENLMWDRVFIKTLSIEFSHVDKATLKSFMESKGYVVVGEVTNRGGLANDFIFVHGSLKDLVM